MEKVSRESKIKQDIFNSIKDDKEAMDMIKSDAIEYKEKILNEYLEDHKEIKKEIEDKVRDFKKSAIKQLIDELYEDYKQEDQLDFELDDLEPRPDEDFSDLYPKN